MKKAAVYFVLTVLGPCGVLAWMTLRTMKEEEAAFERQRVEIAQQQTDAAAAHINAFMTGELRGLELQVEQLLREKSAEQAAADFDGLVRPHWDRAEVGFALQAPDVLVSPTGADDRSARFLRENAGFFDGRGGIMAFATPFSELLNAEVDNAALAVVRQPPLREPPTAQVTAASASRAPLAAPASVAMDAPQPNVAAAAPSRRQSASEGASVMPPGLAAELATDAGGGQNSKRPEPPAATYAAAPPAPAGAARAESAVATARSDGAHPAEMPAPEAAKDQPEPARRGVAPPPPPPATSAHAEKSPEKPKATHALADQWMGRTMERKDKASLGSGAESRQPGEKASADLAKSSLDDRLEENANRTDPAVEDRKQERVRAKPSAAPPPVMEAEAQRERNGPAAGLAAEPPGRPDAPSLEGTPLEFRQVSPQNPSPRQRELAARLTTLTPKELRVADLWTGEKSGIVSRFAPDGALHLLLWCRPASAPEHLFGVELSLTKLAPLLAQFLQADALNRGEFCIALLNHQGQPVAKSHPAFDAPWSRPYVSTEAGRALPHWEIAAYLLDPGTVSRAARAAAWKLGLLVLAVTAAALTGAALIWRESRRRLEEARQKADFVSSVSHELRTPLTSIRMFSDLLAEPSVDPSPDKTRKYAGVISEEAGRLTRLINSVLDFARLERGQTPLRLEKMDLRQVVADTLDHYRPHLESVGFTLRYSPPADPVPVRGDRDRLAQVLLNLLSNAEKYSGSGREIDVSLTIDPKQTEVSLGVCDRGPGVPRGKERKIFEKFFRAHDSLASGIPGTGLGLSLARQLVRAHHGDICCERREGGGSCFRVTLPLCQQD